MKRKKISNDPLCRDIGTNLDFLLVFADAGKKMTKIQYKQIERFSLGVTQSSIRCQF